MKKMNDNFRDVVQILNDGLWHDGSTIGDSLKITRSAVWKVINRLDDYGVNIESVKGKGYSMAEPLVLLNEKQIKKNLKDKKCDLEIFETLDSTNDYLISHPGKYKEKFVIAEQQSKGKGRLGRQWHSPFGQNITLSCLYPFQKDISELAGLSMVVSLAVYETIKTYNIPDTVQVKWPNDIVCDGKKLSGCLIELQAESNGACSAVIGIGINVNMLSDDHREISQAWTSIRKLTGEYTDRNDLCAKLINNVREYLQTFSEKGFAPFKKRWNKSDCLIDKPIVIKNHQHKIQGTAKGVDDMGRIVLQASDNSRQAFSSGDTTIVK